MEAGRGLRSAQARGMLEEKDPDLREMAAGRDSRTSSRR